MSDLTFSCPGIIAVREPMNSAIRRQLDGQPRHVTLRLSEYYSPVKPPNLVESIRKSAGVKDER